LLGLGAALVLVLIAVSAIVLSRASRTPGQPFPRLAAASAPAGWPHLVLPDATAVGPKAVGPKAVGPKAVGPKAVLSYPPSLSQVHGDAGSVTAAQFNAEGGYLLYLNATPKQGAENLPHWAAFRLRFLRSDDATSARLDAATRSVRFRGGTGSCVVDDYVTKIGAHHYKELACLVQGHRGATVIVAAAPAERWAKAGPLLERAVAAYQVR
jgi:hypothetical protein